VAKGAALLEADASLRKDGERHGWRAGDASEITAGYPYSRLPGRSFGLMNMPATCGARSTWEASAAIRP
jgi:hypothetical protein